MSDPTTGSVGKMFSEPVPTPIDADTRREAIGTANLRVRHAGNGLCPDGDVVVFLHPWTGSIDSWVHQEHGFVRGGHQTLSYSRRGYLGSDCGDADDRATAVDDLATLLDVFAVDRFHLVGSAAGAFTAAGYAIRHRDDPRLATLTLACTMLGIAADEFPGLDPVTDFAEWRDLPNDIRELGSSYRAVNRAGVAAWRKVHSESRGDNPPGFLQRLGGPTALAELGDIAVPTLYVAGSADLYSPPPLIEHFVDHTAVAEFAVIDGAGHSAHWECPSTFDRVVLDFIGRRSEGDPDGRTPKPNSSSA